MVGVTLAVAFLSGLLILFVSPVVGLIIYVGVLAWYPSYLTIPIATIDFSASRVAILFLLLKIFAMTDLSTTFKWTKLDKCLVAYFLAQIAAGVIMAESVTMFLINRAGAIFDMMLPYFAVRYIVRERSQYITLLKGILIVVAPLALFGLYQSFTGDNVFGFMRKYHAWGKFNIALRARHGFFRANVTFPEEIMFGLFFAMLGGACIGGVRAIKNGKALYWTGLVLMGLGVFSSMSSGPFLMVLMAGTFILGYRWRRYWKPVTVAVVCMCLVVEVISNRHFYDVLGSFTFNPQTAWYRSQLIEVAFFKGGMADHWITGYGYGVDPRWCDLIDGRDHTDLVNHYLLVLSQFGLVGLIPFMYMNITAIRCLIQAFRKCKSEADRWIVWSLGGTLFGLAGAFVSVSLFQQPLTAYYILLAFAGIMPAIVYTKPTRTQRLAALRQAYAMV